MTRDRNAVLAYNESGIPVDLATATPNRVTIEIRHPGETEDLLFEDYVDSDHWPVLTYPDGMTHSAALRLLRDHLVRIVETTDRALIRALDEQFGRDVDDLDAALRDVAEELGADIIPLAPRLAADPFGELPF